MAVSTHGVKEGSCAAQSADRIELITAAHIVVRFAQDSTTTRDLLPYPRGLRHRVSLLTPRERLQILYDSIVTAFDYTHKGGRIGRLLLVWGVRIWQLNVLDAQARNIPTLPAPD